MPVKNSNVLFLLKGIIDTFISVYSIFDGRAHRKWWFIFFLVIVAAAVEAVGAAIVVPYIAVISDQGYINENRFIKSAYVLIGVENESQFIVAGSMFLLVFFWFKNLFITFATYFQYEFVYSEMRKTSEQLLRTYLYRPYLYHVETNSSLLIRNVGSEVFAFFSHVLVPTIILFSEVFVVLAILIILLVIAPVATAFAFLIIGGVSAAFLVVVRPKIRMHGNRQQFHNGEKIKWIRQALAGIKEITVSNSFEYFLKNFSSHEQHFSEAAKYAMILNQTPRLFIETIALTALFLGVVVAVSLGASPSDVLPTLALFAVAAVRILPSATRIIVSITRISYYKTTIPIITEVMRKDAVKNNLAQKPWVRQKINWEKLKFESLYFKYPNKEDYALTCLNCVIRKGDFVALVGPSGSGKTTFIDLMLGLINPTQGKIMLDSRELSSVMEPWRASISYIPQSIFLLDDSIRRNVAFGVPDEEIEDDKVWKSLELAFLDGHVRTLPEKLNTSIGENGMKFSGGQRQRIGIARALYFDPEVIFFDEATSALDDETEREIANTLESLAGKKTLIIIAHRPETIRRCHKKITLEKGCITQ